MFFRDPWYLILIPFIVAGAVYLYFYSSPRGASMRFSSGKLLTIFSPSLKVILRKNFILIRAVALSFIVIALARPQEPLDAKKIRTKGINIVLAIDTSTSMLAEDFTIAGQQASRINAVKNVAEQFILKRPNDRIGIVVFAAKPYTVCPLTLDHSWLLENLYRVDVGMTEDGTAIGSGLSAAINRLKDTTAKSKVIVLLTDGVNNAGTISPITAAEAANVLAIKTYTIGAGGNEPAPYPVLGRSGYTEYQTVPVEIDENTLEEIARKTGAKYFRATDTKSLRDIYKEIDRMEKIEVTYQGYSRYRELYHSFLLVGLFLLLFELISANTVLAKIP